VHRTSRIAISFAVAFGLAAGCYRDEPRPAYPPPGYYPQQPGYYPPQQPGYPQQPYPQQPYPQQPAQPAPAPSQPQPQGSNPWLDLLTRVISNPPPIPSGWFPAPPGPQPGPTPTTPPVPTSPPPGPPPGPAPPNSVPAIGARALDLANAINRYRQQNGLPPVPISRSLSLVADTHARDLRDSPKLAPNCNGHSWSNKGPWTSCCYTPDHAQAKCMWSKPAELTPLKGTGFEVALGEPGVASGVVLDSAKAIAAWQSSPLHNDVLLNKNTWQKVTWRAMGAGIVDSHATAWFSDTADPVQ
jgi:uncharacterized protein YkwD